jgi:uncharacterized membrane protein HdeD (DUF308 family)
MATDLPMSPWIRAGREELHKRWKWFLGIGVLMLILGTIALGCSVTMTLATVALIGWLMIFGGVAEIVHAFSTKAWGGFFIDLLTGVLYTVAGFFMVANPGVAAVSLTLMIAVLLVFEGVFRIITAVATRMPHWGWLLLHGVVNVLLGLAIWWQWPYSGLWVIGLFVGINMLFNGWTLVMLGLMGRKLPSEPSVA